MNRTLKILSAVVILGIFICQISFAQPPPQVPKAAEAGEVEKRLKAEEPKAPEKKEAPVIVVELPKEEIDVPEGKTIRVRDFEFEGNTVIDKKSLKNVVKKYKNKDLSMRGLKDVTKAVEAEYKKKGFFLAKAYLPPQEVKNGVIKIGIVEGRLGKVTVERGKFYSSRFIRRQFRPTRKGIINYNRLCRSLLILNNYPELRVEAILQKGSAPGTVDVTLKAKDKFPFHASFDFCNFGSRYVSTYRFGFGVEYNSILIEGDKGTYRQVLGSPVDAMLFEDANYSIPISNDGTRLGFEYTQGDFQVQREYKILDAKGFSRIGSLYVQQPVLKGLTANMDWFGSFDYKSIKNYLMQQPNGNDQLRVFKTGVTGDFIDNFRGRNFYGASMSIGADGILHSSPTPNPEGSRPVAGSRFYKFNVDAGRYQKFIWNTFILLKGSAQMSASNLPIAEQMSIGGADSVRGYPESDFLGDYGFTGTAELRMPPPFISNWKDPITRRRVKEYAQILGFLDFGEVWIKHMEPGETKMNYIVGAGFGVRINVQEGLDFRMDIGFPVGGKEPSDGSKASTYVQAITKF